MYSGKIAVPPGGGGERLVKFAAKQNAGNLIAVFLFRVSTKYSHYFSSTKQTCVQQRPRMGNY
jgi:hypothetical protein